MKTFEEKKFNIPKLKGISEKTIEEHLKLYSAYVKHTNLILEKIEELSANAEENMGLISGLQRRFSFEFDGMRNHEYYFSHFEDGPLTLGVNSELRKVIKEEWDDFGKWLSYFKALATTRGVGWAILYYDFHTKRLLNIWVDEQHLGQLNGCKTILALDMWEHSYVADYQPSGKKNYVEDFFANLNWNNVEENFTKTIKT
mgnify:CR=1 FL=1